MIEVDIFCKLDILIEPNFSDIVFIFFCFQIIDESALAWALRERLIAGAALDVYENEPLINRDLLGLDNVVLVPHLGSATKETRTSMADLAVSNVLAVLTDQTPHTPVLPL